MVLVLSLGKCTAFKTDVPWVGLKYTYEATQLIIHYSLLSSRLKTREGSGVLLNVWFNLWSLLPQDMVMASSVIGFKGI